MTRKSGMAEASKSNQEPSMEEILSSIRRIIADEEGGDTAPPASPAPQQASAGPAAGATRAPAIDEDEEVLELTEVVDPGPGEPPPRATASAPSMPAPPRMAGPPSPPPPRSASEPPTRSTAMPAEGDTLLSPNTASASTQSLAKLARAAAGGSERGSGPLAEVTVERLLVDLLSPMLREWLDQNLPSIVERVVEEEVKKLARRAELL
jgi:cell pole-organizing protein PopZ